MPDDLVLNIAAVPTWLQSKPLLKALENEEVGFEDLPHFAWAAARLEALGIEGGAKAMLGAAKPLAALNEAFRSLPFPAPPWAGDECLRPISSRQDLRRVGRKLRNCMGRAEGADKAVSEALRDIHVFYEWIGHEPALLCFENVSPLGWVLQNGTGIQNAPLSSLTWSEIERALSQSSAFAPCGSPRTAKLSVLSSCIGGFSDASIQSYHDMAR